MPTNIGLPSINVAFKQMANTAIQRGNTGILAIILQDATQEAGLYEVYESYDIPSKLNDINKKYLKLSLLGNVTSPKKVVVYVIDGTLVTLENALEVLETVEFNYICMPSALIEDNTKIKTFISLMVNDNKTKVKAVLTEGDSTEYTIICDSPCTHELGELTKAEFCVELASIFCGTPLSQSVAYTVPKGVTNIPVITKAQAGEATKNGKVVLIKEAGKIRIARGVNNFTNYTTEKGDLFSKIKLVDTMDLIHNDIRLTCIEKYIGKVPNNYMNKLVLISAIEDYLRELAGEQLIQNDVTVSIDVSAQKAYLRSLGVKVEAMTEQQIKEANTKDTVFLKIDMVLIDAMEEIDIAVNLPVVI